MPLMAKRAGLLESNRVHHIKSELICPNPGQPRRLFRSEELKDLADSIRIYGILQPLTIRKKLGGGYELIAGERRLRASRLAGLKEVPCIILDADEKQSSLIALVENLQRCDLDFFEEAEGLQRLIYQFGLSQEEAARRVGKSQPAIANKLRLLRHSPEVIERIREHNLTERHARALLRLETPEDRIAALDTIIIKNLNVSQTDEYIDDFLGCTHNSKTNMTPSERIRTLYAFKDIRLFLNSITRAVETIKRSGMEANVIKDDSPEELVLTVRIHKNKQEEEMEEQRV